MNLTQGCPTKGDTSCQLVCQDPSNNQQCIILQAQLIDGSPCGYGGQCHAGQCKSGSILDTFKAWYRQNLNIAIPATIGVAIVIILILGGIARCLLRCRRRRTLNAQRLPSYPTTPQPGEFHNAAENVWIPPPRRPSTRLPSDRDTRGTASYRNTGRSQDGVYLPPPQRQRTNSNRRTSLREPAQAARAPQTSRVGSLLGGIAAWRRNHPEAQAAAPVPETRERDNRSRYSSRGQDRFRGSSSRRDNSRWVDATAYNGDLRGVPEQQYGGY